MKTGWFIFLNALALLWRYRAFALTICLPIYMVMLAVESWIRIDVSGTLDRAPVQWQTTDPYIGAEATSATVTHVFANLVNSSCFMRIFI